MSTTPDSERGAEPQADSAAPDCAVESDRGRAEAGVAETEAGAEAGAVSEAVSAPVPAAPRPDRKSAAALIFDDPLSQQSSDDTDRGWGERPAGGDSATDLARFLDEKPPHHL
ncbi:hypothetical protein [Streptomyces platensis]